METDTEIELLRSRMVIGTVVDQLDLAVNAAPLPAGFMDRFLARRPRGRDRDRPPRGRAGLLNTASSWRRSATDASS
jgi:uncharacterized protein involved in exopolysaccharide biosynthesis